MILLILMFIFSFSLNSCDRVNCINSNQILQNTTPKSIKYKSELSRLLKKSSHSQLTFWFNEYVHNGKNELIFVNVQGDGICAIMELDVKKWDKLQQLRSVKGKGYRGSELKNLQFDILKDSSNIQFVYKDLEQIID